MMVQKETQGWRGVDEGWGRLAADFATLSEPANCREYVAVHHRLEVGDGDRLLDVACGSGLAIELAGVRGAVCAGIDASARLVAIAQDRSPAADIQVGDMHALPWDAGSFDVVTSFRGVWGTTPDVVTEIHRVLTPGGCLGLTVCGHIKASGFVDIQRLDVPFALEFADPPTYARTLASTGPAYEAIQTVGEQAFHNAAVRIASEQVRAGLPLRAEIAVTGYLARKDPATRSRAPSTPAPAGRTPPRPPRSAPPEPQSARRRRTAPDPAEPGRRLRQRSAVHGSRCPPTAAQRHEHPTTPSTTALARHAVRRRQRGRCAGFQLGRRGGIARPVTARC